jgi:hypothetical protein
VIILESTMPAALPGVSSVCARTAGCLAWRAATLDLAAASGGGIFIHLGDRGVRDIEVAL